MDKVKSVSWNFQSAEEAKSLQRPKLCHYCNEYDSPNDASNIIANPHNRNLGNVKMFWGFVNNY